MEITILSLTPRPHPKVLSMENKRKKTAPPRCKKTWSKMAKNSFPYGNFHTFF